MRLTSTVFLGQQPVEINKMAIILVIHNKDAIDMEPDSFGPIISKYLVELAGCGV
jgi:hypothetical protein